MDQEAIKHTPRDRVVIYARIVVDYCPQKKDAHRVRITAGGKLIKYPDKLITKTSDLTTPTIMWNNVIGRQNTRFMCVDGLVQIPMNLHQVDTPRVHRQIQTQRQSEKLFYTIRLFEVCMDYHKQAFWPTNYSRNV